MSHSVHSPADDDLHASLSGSLAASDVESIPTTSTPRADEDAEVGSQRGTHQEEASEAPSGSPPDFAPDSTSEPVVVPESGRRPLRKKDKTVPPAAPVQPEVPDNLLEALKGASIEEEHRTIMSAVIQEVQLAKSGLTGACSILLSGFEASR